jgi:hypothetical protein
MTEFAPKVRHYCRNPKCRSKLPAPVTNEREAFCCRGCYTQFYRRRCVICEQPMERKTERQKICGKRRCINALQAAKGLGRYHVAIDTVSPPKKVDSIGSKLPLRTDRAPAKPAGEHWSGTWATLSLVAGTPVSANPCHCAIVGAGEVLESNRSARRRANVSRIESQKERALAATPERLAA